MGTIFGGTPRAPMSTLRDPMRPSLNVVSCLLGILVLTSACEKRETLRVAAAASLAGVMPALDEAFRATGGAPLQVELGASSRLARQIAAGDPVDVFLSADRRWVREISGSLSESTPLARNGLVVVVPEGHARPATLADLAALDRFAMPSSAVPLGAYARQALARSGVELTNVVESVDARATVAWVVRAEVDGAIVYSTDAETPGLERAFEVEGASPSYVAAATRHGGERGRSFLRFLESDAAKAILSRAGFSAP